MTPTRSGSFHLFKFRGIAVYVHWSWFFVAFYSISTRVNHYTSPLWSALEYVSLFIVVLMHEFGHALACRQVGGLADQIVLWPLGGVAYVDPPERPGATLWSIAAGPLVNVVLLPFAWLLYAWMHAIGGAQLYPNLTSFTYALFMINLSLLIFNLLPIYPLDGGQILRSLLWYFLGSARSLLAVAVIGFIGGLGLLGLAVWIRSPWIGIMTLFLLANCWRGFREAQVLRKLELLPRRSNWQCSVCQSAPLEGRYWLCHTCLHVFDVFAGQGVCPHCNSVLSLVTCPECRQARDLLLWRLPRREVKAAPPVIEG
ncbi:MAG: peptidase M50 [Opitutaceae bacterium]|nr:peptidase M50 [Opitutaceae bacterium]NBR59365.1 peptidase M50 [Opitutaceae bacterium]